ncbi:hypothetical protein CHS0354_034933 [Potamilus streckersoni]|uniref:Receptor ligand binding region domain-containing protein n=1 Tax=Potamilus streckersoni TaxID=2493646 RepID=A0AAE0SDN1_9BIVA|nr:hypothetical protein CHS0354_034933 [Potamilus streckersoni]
MPTYTVSFIAIISRLWILFWIQTLFQCHIEGYEGLDNITVHVGVFLEDCAQQNETSVENEDLLAFKLENYEILLKNICLDHKANFDLNGVFKNSSIHCLTGTVNTEFHQILTSLARLCQKSYVSPLAATIYADGSRVFSIGSSSRKTSSAFIQILNYFEWQNILLIVQRHQYWIEFSWTMMISSADDRFIPTIKYIDEPHNDSSSTLSSTERILASVTSEQKVLWEYKKMDSLPLLKNIKITCKYSKQWKIYGSISKCMQFTICIEESYHSSTT